MLGRTAANRSPHRPVRNSKGLLIRRRIVQCWDRFFLTRNSLQTLIAFNLQPEDFYLAAHRKIYSRILDIALTSRPIDIVSLAEELQSHQELDSIGGYSYLSDLVDLAVPERKHVLYHAGLVMANANLRRIQRIAARAVEAAGVSGADPERLAEEVVRALVRTSGSGKDRHCSEARTAAPEENLLD